ncbi:MAG: hypothetical protein K2O98_04360 [Lachnospiraceae bacterium]|nr:hypothetical protein [Lachnospiraceae bacterium]
MKETLRKLCCLPGLSGYEENVGSYLYQAFLGYSPFVKTDIAGNIIARFASGNDGAKKVMIFSHMDQLGFVVKKTEPDGFLRIERLGGIPEKILPGMEVLVRSEQGTWFGGVIGNKSHHAAAASEKYQVTPIQELYVDLGMASCEEVEGKGILPGCPVVYRPRFQELSENRCYGTAVDNRGGCAVLLDLAKKFSAAPCGLDVYLVATVQEEFNLRGGLLGCASVEPDFAIALDVAITGDTPDMAGMLPAALDKGPVMSMYNFHGRGTLNGTIPHPLLVQMTKEAAGKLRMPLQRSASCGILTDASYVQLYHKGVPVIDLGFPCRYTHTAVELCRLKDLKELSFLVELIVRDTPADICFERQYR